jgi:hypothetical protein
MGVGAVVGRGGDGAEEGEGWVLVAECRFREENECQMTGSNGMETMMDGKKLKMTWTLCMFRE